MQKYQEIEPTSSKQIITIVTGTVYNSIIKNKVVPKGKHKTISGYLEYLIMKDIDDTD